MIIDTTRRLYERCIKRKTHGKTYVCTCKLGIWSVEGPDAASVESDAYHYWYQYFIDGEYDKLLKEKDFE